MIQQIEISITPKSRGFHLVTNEIMRQLPKLPKTGIINIFCKHTSCGLSINENADPDVRVDMETIFNRLVPENRPEYEHTLEGADDMPAHAKSTLSGVSLTIPITDGRLNLGTWQRVGDGTSGMSREDFDELLLERSPRGTYWLHFAVRPPSQENRRKIRFIQT